MKKAKKLLTLALTFLITFTIMPFSAMPADATVAVKGNFSEGRVLKSADGSTFTFSGTDASWMQIYFVSYGGGSGSFKVGPAYEVSPIRAYRVNGEVAYCIEHGVMADETVTLTGRNSEESYLEDIYDEEGLEYIIRNMSLCLLYGRQSGRTLDVLMEDLGFKESSYYKKSASSYNLDDWEAATRQLIHETQQRFRDEKFNKLSTNGLYYEDHWYKGVSSPGKGTGTKIASNHYSKPLTGTGAGDIYNYMAKLIKEHLTLSTKMGGDRKANPKSFNLTQGEDGKWYSKKIPVTKKEAIAVKMVKDSGKEYTNYHIELLQEGSSYYYQYSMDSEPNWDKIYTVKKNIDYFEQIPDDMLIWECKDGKGGHVQALATGSCDPVARYVKFTKDTAPEPEPNEPPEPEYFPQIQITVDKEDLNPGWDGDTHTGMGDAGLAATYVIYRDGVEVDRLTLDEYGNAVTLSDTPWKTVDDLTKSESGTTASHTAGDPPSDHCGTAAPTRYDWNGSVTYTIKEIRPDGRFIEPDTGERSVTVHYNAYTTDQRDYACQSQNWAEVIYTVNTSTAEGITLTTQNGMIDAVSDPINAKADTFINDCYRGKLTLSKSLENSDVFSERKSGTAGGEKDSTKSLWKLKLNSGGWESHPYVRFTREADLADGTAVYRVTRDASGEDNTITQMKIGTNGDLLVLDIPYGEYTMSEVSADDDSFVKETLQVKIDEHDKAYSATEENDDRYDYNIRDKKKTNVIKIIKTNAETGKQVTAAGTKFYIRYMGDPLLDDPTTAKNYGRLLPNAEEITKKGPYTWEADENGEVTIPYELEWGLYRIEEWLLPEGYFVGAYSGGSAASSCDYGEVEEGQQKALALHGYSDLVGIYDASGKKVRYKDKDSYALNEVFNFYTFRVEKQAEHSDGNFASKVTSDAKISDADTGYDSANFPYTAYYKAVAMANNMVKGKIEINKTGEILTGFKKTVKDGRTVFTPVYKSEKELAGAIFGIYAAEDILLNDGNDGAKIYNSRTDEEITIPMTKSTHEKNTLETVQGLLSKFFTGTTSVYETGETEVSGGKLWYLKERAAKEDGRYTRIYVSPEQKDTTYSYKYSAAENGFSVSYDIDVSMNYQAGGKNVTDINVTKTTTADGYALEIPTTLPAASVGDVILNPAENYLKKTDETDTSEKSSFTTSNKTYTFEAAGKINTDKDGNPIDLSDIGVKRYEAKDYEIYKLRAADVKTEERVVTPAEDKDGDGIIDPSKGDVEEVKETKTVYEWEHNCELVTKTAGAAAIIKMGESEYKVDTTGYYENAEYKEQRAYIPCVADGSIIKEYTLPEGYDEVAFTGDRENEPHYIIASMADPENAGATLYRILLSDGATWQECDENGNFKKSIVQSYTARYLQASGDTDGFSFSWDGFQVSSSVDSENSRAITTITKQVESIVQSVSLGAGYERKTEGLSDSFTASEAEAPIYFKSKDGIKTEMQYLGGKAKVTIALPQSAVDKDFENVVPSLNFKEDGRDNIVDWYSALSPDNPVAEGNPIPGASWKASRMESPAAGGEESYQIEILTSAGSDNPLEISFADGYTMSIYADTAESGSGVGIIELDGVYKTNRAPKSKLVDTVTTDAEGKAVSKLLPLGKYIVKELYAPNGYVTDHKAYEVELKYKDQFTPLVWENLALTNTHYMTEIELEKVFETAYESKTYEKGSGAVFGLYAGERLTGTGGTEISASIEAGSLIDVITPDDNGRAKAAVKLPEGIYYIKELATRNGYILNDIPFYFVAGEDVAVTSTPCSIGYDDTGSISAEDGVSAEVVLVSAGKAAITVETQERYPMPGITIDGTMYALTEDLTASSIKITKGSGIAKAEIEALEGVERKITLPNGKPLTVKVTGNTYTYTYAGVTNTFVPSVSFTGFAEKYESKFSVADGESLAVKKDTIRLTEAESDSATVITVTHTPITRTEIITAEIPAADLDGDGIIDPAAGDIAAVPGVTKTVGVLDNAGKQKYTHTAEFTYADAANTSAITGDITRVRDKALSTEAATDVVRLIAGDTAYFTSNTGAKVSIALDKAGSIKCLITNTLAGSVKKVPILTVNGTDKAEELIFSKTVSLARQEHSAGCLQIKINSADSINPSGITNDAMPPDIPYVPTTPRGHSPAIGTLAKDSKTKGHIALAGKDTTIIDTVYFYNLAIGQEYKLVGKLMDKETGEAVVAGGKQVTSEVTFKPSVSTGTQEVAFTFDANPLAGKDIVVFETLYKVTKDKGGKAIEEKIASHEDINDRNQTVTIAKEPNEPNQPDQPDKPNKPNKPDKPTEVPKTGDKADLWKWLGLIGFALLGMLLSMLSLRKVENKHERRERIDE